LPVTIAGVLPHSRPYSSISHAITWALVFTSGAMMSRLGPSILWILLMNERAIACSSAEPIWSPGQSMPPLAPPNGTPAIAVFHVISIASARTELRSTSGWKRRPPLYGPRAPLCWTR
jgi:hypothetical protein